MNPILDEIDKRRQHLGDEPYRLFHGRGQTIPGYEFLTIDWYPPLVLITLYEERGRDWVDRLAAGIKLHLNGKLEAAVVQVRGWDREAGRLLFGDLTERFIIREAGLRYRVDPLAGQNIGFFPDMRPGRRLVRDLSREKKVLNLFAYSCSLSVAAMAGGARQVVNLDMNRNLLELGRENHRLNGQDLRNISFLPYNLFKSFGRLKKLAPFDLVVIDPPYRQGTSFRAERDWPKILRKMPELVSPTGQVIAAVSAPELGRRFLAGQVSANLPDAQLLTERTANDDFPEADPDRGLHLQHYSLMSA